jgi:hypothetical protein
MKQKDNLGIVPQIKSGGEYKSCSNAEITIEDIREWKAQLDAKDIPSRVYGGIIGTKESLDKLMKEYGIEGVIAPINENWNTF